MRKLLLVFAVLFSFNAKAQIDLSVNPVLLLFSNFDFAAEYRATTNWGLELSPGIGFSNYSIGNLDYKSTGFGARFIAKYYFGPEKSCDKWNIGPYIKYGTNTYRASDSNGQIKVTSTKFAVGFYTGYKWAFDNNLVFELGFGLGRAFINEYSTDNSSVDLTEFISLFRIDATGKLALGYRFGN